MEKTKFSYKKYDQSVEIKGWICLFYSLLIVIFVFLIEGIGQGFTQTAIAGLITVIGFLLILGMLLTEKYEVKKEYLKYNFQVLGKYKDKSLKKKWKLFTRIHGENFKQWGVVTVISLGAFLPVRLIFYNYVSHSWLGNLGVMSAIAIILFLLIHYNKIGIVGVYFRNKITRIVFSKIGYTGLVISVLFASQWGVMLYLVDLAEFDLVEERNYFYSHLIYGSVKDGNFNLAKSLQDINLYPEPQYLYEVASMNKTVRAEHFINTIKLDDDFQSIIRFTSFTLHAMNEEWGAWGSHFATVFMVEELEAIALFFFYRKVYRKQLGVSWSDLGLYDGKTIKKFCKQKIENSI